MKGTRLFLTICLVASAALLFIVGGGALQPHDISAEARAGWGVWRAQGCEGCHTIFGQGGAFAPDLTHSYSQRGEEYLREFMANPAAFFPEHRLMPISGLTQSETDNLIAFLEWVETQGAAGTWPPKPILVSGAESVDTGTSIASNTGNTLPNDPVARGEYWFKRPPAICSTCHSLEPDVRIVGPSLAGIATTAQTRVPGMSAEQYIRDSILRPGDYVVEGFPDAMQRNFGEVLDAQQINDIIAFLMTLE
jgi:cytochrome c2